MKEVSYKEKAGKEFVEDKNYNEENQSGYKSTISLDGNTEHDTHVLTYSEASECLHNLGKCAVAQCEYAYLSMDVSDKGLTDVSVIPFFKHVRYVNVSGNRLTSEALHVLETMPYLQMLRADRNRLVSAELKPMPYLQVTSSFLFNLEFDSIERESLRPQREHTSKTTSISKM